MKGKNLCQSTGSGQLSCAACEKSFILLILINWLLKNRTEISKKSSFKITQDRDK